MQGLATLRLLTQGDITKPQFLFVRLLASVYWLIPSMQLLVAMTSGGLF
jgi:hypothetical protein